MIEGGGGGGGGGWVNKKHGGLIFSGKRRMPLPKTSVRDFESGE